MALNVEKKERISEVIKKILASRAENFPKIDHKNRNAPFHELIIKRFEEQFRNINIPTPYLFAISSWLHGLSTSLGNSFEDLSHIISGGYKREFTGAFTLRIKKSQAEDIDNIIRELKRRDGIAPNLDRENKLIFNFRKSEPEVDALGFTVDNYIETEIFIEGIELKSVRPNSGEGRGEKQKILHAKAAFKNKNPEKETRYYIGFPFDPTSDSPTGYDKERFFSYLIEFKKFFSPDEVLIASELWDHLSGGKNTMEEILEVISITVEKILRKK
ncbi:MAG: TdeIII family type II restriction endonuclease [Candidatus Levyibacteriota bacterium]